MLNPTESHESFTGKLLLSSALVAASLAYGWWQRDHPPNPAITMAPIPAPPVPKTAPAHIDPATPPPASIAATTPAKAAPTEPKSSSVAMAAPPPNVTTAVPASPIIQPAQSAAASSPTAPLSAQSALQMYLPTDDVSPPLPPATGTPPAGVAPAIPAGTHLEDGDYLSDKHQFEWGDLVVKISIHGGQIVGVQILQYPDHRSQSLYLSQVAGPTLESELIKTQQAQVDVVSSATDTSYAFQDAITNAITKATRG